MNVQYFQVGPLSTNCFLAVSETGGEAVLIDPGGVSDALFEAVGKVALKAILLTHGHFDHIIGADAIAERTGAPIMIHPDDRGMLTDHVSNGSFMIGGQYTVESPVRELREGDTVSFGDYALEVIHTPGHTPGGVSFLARGERIFGGDTLFRLSVGRWDLPGGDYDTLLDTIRGKFKTLDDGIIVHPGHGEDTTIGFERLNNQFMQ